MYTLRLVVLAYTCTLAVAGAVEAQESSASGALGAGVLGAQPATAVDLGFDVTGEHYTMGFGARLRWVMGDEQGFRTADWDERSEWALLLRYLSVRRDGEVRVRAAAGELGGATLGHGTIISDYTSGLDVDHAHLGMQLRADSRRYAVEAVIDDLVAPRITGVRAARIVPRTATQRAELGISAIADLAAPALDGDDAAMAAPMILPMAIIDGRYELGTPDRRRLGAVYADLVAIATVAAGAHLGLEGQLVAHGAHMKMRGELSLGTASYIPGWIGPLYEHDRRALGSPASPAAPGMAMAPPLPALEVARSGGLGGLGGMIELAATHPDFGAVKLAYRARPGLTDQLVMRLSIPYFQRVQGAMWLAAELGDDARTWAGGSELRAHIAPRFFATLEAAHIYRQQERSLVPVWWAMAAVGAVIGL